MVDNDLKFSNFNHSYYSPALVVKPTGSLGKKCNFYLRVIPESDIYSFNKFSPNTNNIDCQWYFKNSKENGKLKNKKKCFLYIIII